MCTGRTWMLWLLAVAGLLLHASVAWALSTGSTPAPAYWRDGREYDDHDRRSFHAYLYDAPHHCCAARPPEGKVMQVRSAGIPRRPRSLRLALEV